MSNRKVRLNRGVKLNTSSATRRLVIPDIHGCSKTLQALLEQIQLEKSDYLFFLGDFIDKGIDSKGVLDIVIDLINQDYNIFPLMGNHESDLVDTVEESSSIIKFHKRDKLENLLIDEFTLQQKYKDFLFPLPYYYELEDYYLVHAGFNFKVKEPFRDFESMLWLRKYSVDMNATRGKRVIHGHTPTPVTEIQKAIDNAEDKICLDAGAFLYDYEDEGVGILLCLDLDSFQLFKQPNLERERIALF